MTSPDSSVRANSPELSVNEALAIIIKNNIAVGLTQEFLNKFGFISDQYVNVITDDNEEQNTLWEDEDLTS